MGWNMPESEQTGESEGERDYDYLFSFDGVEGMVYSISDGLKKLFK